MLVRKLVDAHYHGRRVRFGDVTGTVRGLVQPMGLSVRYDGSTAARPGALQLHLIDDRGRDHRLPFAAEDRAYLLD
ncbi:hypothetical protein A7R75_30220 [Mycolicibacterium llatzerense]|nr:hypothetical protein [Mycolicibacterium llatzerense]